MQRLCWLGKLASQPASSACGLKLCIQIYASLTVTRRVKLHTSDGAICHNFCAENTKRTYTHARALHACTHHCHVKWTHTHTEARNTRKHARVKCVLCENLFGRCVHNMIQAYLTLTAAL